jgi:hypothetical protein
MKAKKRHYICWLKFWVPVEFNEQVTSIMQSHIDTHRWGWKTLCGEIFWPIWNGTTNKKDVTCGRCKKKLAISARMKRDENLDRKG